MVLLSYYLGEGEIKKSVDKDMAIELWKLLLTNKFKLLPEWLKFVEVSKAENKTY
jgi:hypothetical protein